MTTPVTTPAPTPAATTASRTPPLVSDTELLADAAIIAVASVAISLLSKHLLLMTLLIPCLMVARMALWALVRRPAPTGRHVMAELAFLLLCTALGGFNDWSSVVRYRIYDYSVPHYFPSFSTIPIWMLLYWGLILRALAALTRWQRLSPPTTPANTVRLGVTTLEGPWIKVATLLLLVLATRQGIYRFYLDPWLSWLPFAAAAILFALLFGLTRHDRRLCLLILIGGPAVEVLYIQVGHLHHYHLGWLGGVPLWIALWWLVALLVWKDLSARIQARLLALFGG